MRLRSFAKAMSTIFVMYFSTGQAVAQTSSQQADSILRRAMNDRRIPGMQAAVILNGKVIFSHSYGVANLQTPVPVGPQTVFTINSITKSFVGIAAMEEVERGRLDLSVPISTYLTDIPESWRKVTTSQLLGQISGLPDIFAYGNADLNGIRDEKAAWAWALSQPVSPPGETVNYCQTNLRLVQLIINKLEGRDPDASLMDEQLKKAHMIATTYGDSTDVIKNKSQPYQFGDDRLIHNHYEWFGPMMRANAGLNSTAEDMARWMISILYGQQLTQKSLESLWRLVPLNDGSPSSFALGWERHQLPNYVSVGMVGGTRAAVSLYPKYNLGVVILTNLMGSNPEELTDEVAASFVSGIKLSGISELRAEIERSGYEHLEASLAAAEVTDHRDSFDQQELETWISRVLFSKNYARAVALAKFDRALFPKSVTPLELLARSYNGNKQFEEETRTYRELLAQNPTNKAAMSFFEAR
jgi:CubicO group peptidase (beta-lactamase class C family)